MNRTEELRELFAFNTWAARRMFESLAVLSQDELTRDLGNSFPSIRDTLIHIVGADWVWLERWHGTSPRAFPDAASLATLQDIALRWQQIDDARRTFLSSLKDADLDRVVHYTSFAGMHFAFPLWQMLRHVVNHGSYHRGQVTTLLKQLGHKPMSTDMILMYQEIQKEKAAIAPAAQVGG